MSAPRPATAVMLAVALVTAPVAAVPLDAALLLSAVAIPAAADSPDCPTAGSTSGAWRAPFTQRYVRTSPFGMRLHPIEHVWRLHSGVDLASVPSPGPVVASHAGTVTAAVWRPGVGLSVDLAHGDGVMSRYGHLARIAPGLRPGVRVSAGQQLGLEGSTGTSTGVHLHFEIQERGVPVDPVPFMAAHGAPLDGTVTAAPTTSKRPATTGTRGRPPATGVRLQSVTVPAAPIPARVRALYVAAGKRYGLPWTLLAGIGMEETRHGAVKATSSAGARGLMQFMPATWRAYGVDGDGDGRAVIDDDADSVHSAAHYLSRSGANEGAAGVRRALFAYNHADWYVADVLFYAHAYEVATSGSVPVCASPIPTTAGGAP
ncbi:peptidoglycan DD-metalloendopeptidase family protein [Phycicoccus sp. MAQZ13P-2]|uniref:peptidoglycan DD-metalloendopeptidase family protein n=1 Tax=Phycicoccus mangrovi TaxID=2840470 RepID=UPI001C00453F|nr:peptidoglycan DD-metalloendopeptidase family protein [Phycicoccus mangrovi]MBT9257164.1 peptidoglycan DD-metalloendopeptidase family protein [Phycicoccus mangrovi]MBT9276337.1 peptidoglycan DD-metalloendopeptidase family protein [Phycicoccus mangrovi]